jgi:hypothetical protein
MVVKTSERVIEHGERTMLASCGSNPLYVGYLEQWVARGLEHQQARRRLLECCLDAIRVLDRKHCVLHAIACEQAPDHVPRGLVHFSKDDDVIALLAQREQRQVDGGHA